MVLESVVLPLQVCSHILRMSNRMPLALAIPVLVIMTAEEPDLVQTGKEAPILLVRDEFSPAVHGARRVAGEILGVMVVQLLADEAGHEDRSRRRLEVYLVSHAGGAVGDVMDGDFVGHDVLEIDEVEVESIPGITWASTEVHIRVERLLAKSLVSCEIGSHLESDLCCAVLLLD